MSQYNDIRITPNVGVTSDPKIEFTGAGNSTITLKVTDGTAGEVVFENENQKELLSLIDGSPTDPLFSINDSISLPALQVYEDGRLLLAPYAGYNIGIGTTNPTSKLSIGDTNIDLSLTWPERSPTLNLSFSSSKALDSRITFTRTSTGTYVDQDGYIKTDAANQPRFDHHPITGKSLGLLVESSVLVGGRFQLGGSNLTGTANVSGVIAPDGTETAFRAEVIAAGGGYETIGEHAAESSNGIMFTISVFAKAGEVGKFTLVGGSEQSSKTAIFDVTNGTIAVYPTHQNSSATIEPFKNGWYRCSTTFLRENASTNYFFFWLPQTNVGSGNDYEWLSGQGMYFWGLNIAKDIKYPTSWVDTRNSGGYLTTTRSADVVSISGSNFTSIFTGQYPTGTLYTEYSRNYNFSISPNTKRVWTFYNGTTNNNVQIRGNGTSQEGFYVVDGGTTGAVGLKSVPAKGISIKAATSWDSSTMSASFDGSEVSSTSISLPFNINPNVFSIGSYAVYSTTFFDGHISRILYWPEKLSDINLKTLTA